MIYVLCIQINQDYIYKFPFSNKDEARKCELKFWKDLNDEKLKMILVDEVVTLNRKVAQAQIMSTEIVESKIEEKDEMSA